MPGSATVNCAWLWNKQHLFLLISSSLSVSKFVSVGARPLPHSLSLSLSNTCSLGLCLSLCPLYTFIGKFLQNMKCLTQARQD